MMTSVQTNRNDSSTAQQIDFFGDRFKAIKTEVAKMIVGQEQVVEDVLTALCAGGHVLLEGVPGLGKTMLVSAISQSVDLPFSRIQFTPDMMPADIQGASVLLDNEQGGHELSFQPGPIMSNLVLADEINRATPKTQSALLEVMQEKQVTVGKRTIKLDEPFCVMATQNPVDQEGTYPLPEAQVDRFMMKVHIDYPSKADEMEVMRRMANMSFSSEVNAILSKEEIFEIRNLINAVKMAEPLEHYIIELVFATRFPEQYGLKEEAKYIQFGVSPRASINLNLASKAVAFMDGRDYVLPEDIKEIAEDVLNHRIILNYEAEADGINTRDLVKILMEKVPINKSVTLK